MSHSWLGSLLGALGLLGLLAGCDEQPESASESPAHGAEHGEGDDAPGQQDPSAACEPDSPVTASLLDAGRCELGGRAVASCDPTSRLRRTCDLGFVSHCQEQGGDVKACGTADLPPAAVFFCADVSPLHPPCDRPFIDACDAVDGHFATLSLFGRLGACATPYPDDLPAIIFCCAVKIETGGFKVGNGCQAIGSSVDDVNECIKSSGYTMGCSDTDFSCTGALCACP